jgi:hypothetical protein
MFFDILNVWRARRKIDGSSKLKICTVFKAVYDITLLKSQRGLRTKPLIDGSHQSTITSSAIMPDIRVSKNRLKEWGAEVRDAFIC